MNKFALFGTLLVLVIFSSIDYVALTGAKATPYPTATPPNEEPIYCPPPTILLSAEHVILPCLQSEGSLECASKSVPRVNVRINAIHPDFHPDDSDLKYIYKVSAGSIHGDGVEVIWDLSNADAGVATIEVDVEGPENFRVHSLKTLTVERCKCEAELVHD